MSAGEGASLSLEGASIPMEVQLQVPSKDWLEVCGLLAQNLTLDQILPSIGFHQSTGHVDTLERTVSSQYADGLFVQHCDSTGRIYNLCGANSNSLKAIEDDLQEILALFKARYKWLNSGSRLTFGVVYGRKVVILMDTCATENAPLKSFLDVVVSTVREQLVHVDEFNIIRCSSSMEVWRSGLTEKTEENIVSAIEWVEETTPQITPFKTNVVEGIIKALAHSNAEYVYLFAHGECTLRAFDLLMEKVSPSLIPVHVVVYDCKSTQALDQYKQLANASGARCHAYNPSPAVVSHESRKNPLLSSYSSISSAESHSLPPQKRPTSAQSTSSVGKHSQSALSASSGFHSTFPCDPVQTPLPNDDVVSILAEIEQTRDILAEIQALQLEVGVVAQPSTLTEAEIDEDSLTSLQWLEVHGIKTKKLRYEDLVASLAFQHCNGIVQIPVPKYKTSTQTIELVPHSRIVHAQYCKDFVHVRWNAEKTVHVWLTPSAHKTYRGKVEGVVDRCVERLAWLKNGSRQLFGTLLESKVVVVIDTSSSVKERLDLIKAKVKQLLQEQLSQKKEFTFIHFSSEVHPWRTSLVPVSPQNLEAVGQWVQSLYAEGSTNTLGALEMAMSIREAEGVYLLTDGRPDQPLDEITARVQQLPSIPVHTISFNCADSKANYFLSQLATNTGGRYYYFSEDSTDPEGPNAYQGEDIQKLEDEMKYGREQLQLADHLLSECNTISKKGTRRKTGKGRKSVIGSIRRTNRPGKKKLFSSKKWLEKNSLSALNLTLMDAFGPAAIPHTTKHVPLLSKSVSSKVFTSLFPLAHVTNGNDVTLINPNGVNLKEYEGRLDKQIRIYQDRLTQLAWSALSKEEQSSLTDRCGLSERDGEDVEGSNIPPYMKHRDKIRTALSECGWLRPKEDFDLLEREIDLANNFKKYLRALKKEVEQGSRASTHRESQLSLSDNKNSDESENEVVGLYSPPGSGDSLLSLIDKLQQAYDLSSPPTSSSIPRQNRQVSHKRHLKGLRVIVKSEDDGFYYPGLVVSSTKRRHVIVELVDKCQITTKLDNIILMGGAGPCPILSINDHVLIRVRIPNGPHPLDKGGSCDCYIPGVILALPENIRKGHALYSAVVYNGKSVTCSRRGIIKISKSKYLDICNFIKSKSQMATKSKDASDSHSKVSSRQSSIHIPQANDSPCSAHSTNSLHTYVSALSVHSQSESTASSGTANQSHTESRISPAQSQSGISSLPSLDRKQDKMLTSQKSEDIGRILELQQSQRELLEQQQRDLDTIQLRQQEMEARLKLSNKVDDAESRQEVEEAANNSLDSNTLSNSREIPPPVGDGDDGDDGGDGGDVKEASLVPVTFDQAVNTDTWTEDRGVGTDPMMESRGVGTEWSESETDSDSDIIPLGRSLDHCIMTSTPIPSLTPSPQFLTPLATPTHHSSHYPSPSPTPSTIDLTPSHDPPLDNEPDDQHSKTTPPNSTLDHPSSTIGDLPQLGYYSNAEKDPLVNQHVLARWPDDGWYYRGVVIKPLGQMWYQVMDASEDVETIHALDIIIDMQDALKPLQVGDTVAGLHPHFPYSYAPGKITGIAADGYHISLKLYDDTESLLPRQEVYHLAKAKHLQDIEYLKSREQAWMGQEVVARRDKDGLYLPGEVVKQLSGYCQYLVRWKDNSTQVEDIIHMFGKLTKKRELRLGDHVLALAIPSQGIFMPGIVQEKAEIMLQVQFCDGQSSLVDPNQCFWLSLEYYDQAVEFIANSVSSSSLDSKHRLGLATVTESDITSE